MHECVTLGLITSAADEIDFYGSGQVGGMGM